jgi:hypothetical protein
MSHDLTNTINIPAFSLHALHVIIPSRNISLSINLSILLKTCHAPICAVERLNRRFMPPLSLGHVDHACGDWDPTYLPNSHTTIPNG